MTVARRALVVDLTITMWTARKYDKQASKQVDAANNAEGAGRFNKILIDPIHLKPINQVAVDLRQLHAKLTLPWGNKGERVILVRNILDYDNQMAPLIEKFQSEATDFTGKYDELRQAARKRLGALFSVEDYPLAAHIKNKFSVSVSRSQIGDPSDFRLDITGPKFDELRAEVEKNNAERINDALLRLRSDINERVTNLRDKMMEEKPIFRDSLLEHVQFYVDNLDGFNLLDDPSFDNTRDKLAATVSFSPDTLRASPEARAKTVEACNAFLDA